MSNTSKTDWSRIDAIATARLRLPVSLETTVAIRVDSETLEWFQHQGKEAEKHMAAALRIYAEAHKYTDISHKAA